MTSLINFFIVGMISINSLTFASDFIWKRDSVSEIQVLMAFRLLKDALPAQSRVSERQEKYAQVDQGCDLHENGQNVVPQHVDSRI